MRQMLFALILCLLFCLPQRAWADDTWVIENFQSQIAVGQSGIVSIVETISVDFRNTPEHGIYRDIPYLYQANGQQKYTDIHLINVLQNGEPAQYMTSHTNGYEEIKIGDPIQTIVGRNVYTISYTVTGVLRQITNNDEFYWNVTGNNWPVSIQKAEATVTLPEAGITKIICYEGVIGSQMACQSNLYSQKVATFVLANRLASYQGLTIAVDYAEGLIPLLVAKAPVPYWEQLFLWPWVLVAVLVIIAGLGFMGYVWNTYGRDCWFAGILFSKKNQKGKAKPIGAHGTIPVEFTPPENLRPAEIGILMDERADARDVAATIIDLATRGYITITEIPKKWLFGKVDYRLQKTMPIEKNKELLPYEKLLLDTLFFKRKQIKLSNLNATFYLTLPVVIEAMYAEVITKKFFPQNPEKVRRKYVISAGILILGGIWWLTYGYMHGLPVIGDAGLGCLLDGIVIILVSRFMPTRSAYGRELYQRSKGYYLFISSAEKYRQCFIEKQNIFTATLPYVIVFGLTKKFARQLEKLDVKSPPPDWYVGQQQFSTGVLIATVDNFSNSLSLAIAQTPSGSGGLTGRRWQRRKLAMKERLYF